MATGGTARSVPLRRRARRPHYRRGSAGADPVARDPAGLAGRLDLAQRDRKGSGDRARRGRTAPVHLPPRLSRPARAGEVRQAHQLRRAAPGPASRDVGAHGPRRPRPGTRECRRDEAHQPRLVPRRQRAVREAVEDVRHHDADQEARQRARAQDRLPVPHEAQGRRTHDPRRRGDLRRPQGAARTTRRAAPLPLRVGAGPLQPHGRPAQRLHPALPRGRLHRQGLPDVGRHPDRGNRVRRARPCRDEGRAEARRGRRDAEGRRPARQHTRRRARIVRQSGRGRPVSGGSNDRGFSPPSFTDRRRS